MNTTADPRAASSIRDAVDVLAHADAVLAETIQDGALDNRSQVAEVRVGLLVVREMLSAMAKAAEVRAGIPVEVYEGGTRR